MSNTSTYIAVTSVYETREKGKPQLKHPGEEVELDQESAEHLLERGAVRKLEDEDRDRLEVEPEGKEGSSDGVLQRPSTNASKDDWRAYASSLPGGGPDLPAGARREEIIAAVDAYEANPPQA